MVLTWASSSVSSASSSAAQTARSVAFARSRSSSSRSLSFSSPAAFSVNVTATISFIVARPVARICRIRAISSVVLPVPAAASTISVSSRSFEIACRASVSTSVSFVTSVSSVREASSHRPQRVEIRQALARFPLRALLLARPAHSTEVAPGAGALAGRRREESALDGSIDDRQHLQPLTAGVVVDRDFALDEAAGGRRVEKPAGHHLLAEPLLDREAVQHRLKRGAAADDEIRRRAVPAGLVVGDAQHVEIGAMLDQIDRPPEHEAIVDEHRLRQAARIASLVVQPETELEVGRLPRGVVCQLLHPDAEVAPQIVDLVPPDA